MRPRPPRSTLDWVETNERYFHAPTAAFLFLLLVMRVASSATAGACYFALCGYALLGEKYVVRALAISWLLTLWNPSLGPPPSGGTAGRFLLIGVCMLSCFVRWKGLRGVMLVARPVLMVSFLGAFFCIHSVLFSREVDVSLLKAISWTAAAVTLVCAWGRLSASTHSTALWELQGLLVFVLLASLPFLWTFHGYFRNGSGFQGILSHPQVLGPTMALLSSMLLAEVVAQRRPEWWKLGALAVGIAFVVASEARTAGFALVLGVLLGLVLKIEEGARWDLSSFKGLTSRRLLGSIGVGFLLGLAQAQRVATGVRRFVEKGGHSEGGVFAAYQESRGGKMAETWEGFLRHPIVGNGFGLPSVSSGFEVVYDATTGLPTAAPVEKGVLPLAVLEDVGLIGAVLVGLWLWDAVRRARKGSLVSLSLLLTALATNMAEANLFSPGGMGLLVVNCLAFGASNTRAGEGTR
jgi:hypothetical protein